MLKYFLASLALLVAVSIPGLTPEACAASRIIPLPAPDKTGGMPLMQALNARQTNRSIKPEALPESEISNLVWAAWGINRSDGKRTAPTARNEQKVLLHVAMESGVWLYDAQNHNLQQVMTDDLRSHFGNAPLTLVYSGAADVEYSGMHMGSMYQNAGLYCASAGLANVVKITGVKALGNLPLPAGYRVFVIQPVGYPR